ncbi:hypothetical protein [Swaminathania salitolerans]|uniref:Uncharacterized protein n=1 Tax=Swaminathania salitolerans TaxID=182838 RepID=A0A511BM92_9PROT|nr:hypothetical protein [Swaminathania salitolerans]GBQ15484.1 hypothetical protein AA21291_2186 [Swaminathania salitolerans LMG 21291]GEL01375.1 hypothetical protein SSA02_05380 [Swaminathania salitolerans]
MPITIDPELLPPIDIIRLAQEGHLLRAERTTPEGGVPAFISSADRDRLLTRHPEGADVASTERAVHHLLAHAAQGLTATGEGVVPARLSLKTDLFEDEGETWISFVRDASTAVACVIIGSRPVLTDTNETPSDMHRAQP